MKKLRIVFILLFIVMFGGASIWSFLYPAREFSDMENRSLQQLPAIGAKSILSGKFQKKYEKYLSDQIFMRDNWVDFYAGIRKVLGRKEINGVYLGNDGYLIEKFTEEDFDEEILEKNTLILADFLNICSDYFGTKNVSCLFVPSKIDVLVDKLPVFADVYSGSHVAGGVKKLVKNKKRVRNLQDALLEHADEYIYYRTDHHWTTLGAYYGYCEFQKLKGDDVPEASLYKKETVFNDFYGTSYNKAHIKTKPDEVCLFHTNNEDVTVNINNGEIISDSFYFKDKAKSSFDKYSVFFSKNTKKIEINTKNNTPKTLLVVKDSFANCFVPFLAASYDKIIMVDCRYNKGKIGTIFREYKDITDVLVLFNIEKFREDTHLSFLELNSSSLEKEISGKDEKNNASPGDDILDGLISLD